MAEVRGARRAAEKAARARLGGPLISAAGELGVAAAQRETATAGVVDAENRAREHLRRAQAEAQRMVADARALVAAADEQYRRVHDAARTAGLVLRRAHRHGLRRSPGTQAAPRSWRPARRKRRLSPPEPDVTPT